jgi:hypothetical protein
VSILMGLLVVNGRVRGMVPASKVSMMIMRPPQQGKDERVPSTAWSSGGQ